MLTEIPFRMILVAGSANLDFVVQVPHIAAPGETVSGSDLALFPGGKGANQAIACARAGGAKTEMLLALGDDWFAKLLEQSLSEAGVRLHRKVIATRTTGCAFVSVAGDGENAIALAPGANEALRSDDLPSLAGCSHLLMQLETPMPVVAEYAREAKQQGVTVVLNAAPAQELSEALIGAIDILIVNEGELSVVSRCRGNVAACLERIGIPRVVVTLGSRGCCARDGVERILQPSIPVTAVDTTAAGDTFCGVFVAALSRGKSMQHALKMASAAGALACTRLGAQTSIPHAAQVEECLDSDSASSDGKADRLRQYCGFDG